MGFKASKPELLVFYKGFKAAKLDLLMFYSVFLGLPGCSGIQAEPLPEPAGGDIGGY